MLLIVKWYPLASVTFPKHVSDIMIVERLGTWISVEVGGKWEFALGSRCVCVCVLYCIVFIYLFIILTRVYIHITVHRDTHINPQSHKAY